MPRRPSVNMLLRLPPDLHANLAAWAADQDRSLHAHVVHLLRKAEFDHEVARWAALAHPSPSPDR